MRIENLHPDLMRKEILNQLSRTTDIEELFGLDKMRAALNSKVVTLRGLEEVCHTPKTLNRFIAYYIGKAGYNLRELSQQERYYMFCNTINNLGLTEDDHKLFEHHFANMSLMRATMNLACFYADGFKTYLFEKKFAKDFLDVKLSGLRMSDIAKPLRAYIRVPNGLMSAHGELFKDIYVFVGTKHDIGLYKYGDLHDEKRSKNLNILSVIYVDTFSNTSYYHFPLDFDEHCKDLEKEILNRIKSMHDDIFNARESIHQILKVIAYIHSGQPDIREFKNELHYRGNSSKVIKKDQNLSQENIHLVGYNWKKAPIYHVDSTRVSGHFRWQRYDKGLSKVKLTWINEHERNFRKPGNDSRFISAGLI